MTTVITLEGSYLSFMKPGPGLEEVRTVPLFEWRVWRKISKTITKIQKITSLSFDDGSIFSIFSLLGLRPQVGEWKQLRNSQLAYVLGPIS